MLFYSDILGLFITGESTVFNNPFLQLQHQMYYAIKFFQINNHIKNIMLNHIGHKLSITVCL